MAMQKSKRRELNKLRELFWFFIYGKRCAVCKELFVESDLYELAKHGDARGEPLSIRLTIDHKNGDHSDNRPQNHRLVHERCHKIHHAKHMRRMGGKFLRQGELA